MTGAIVPLSWLPLSQAAETYAFDEKMAEKLRKANPQAFGNIVKRMLEAAGRGMWNPDEQKLEQLRSMYADIDSQIEGV
jgi:magnesium chelatase subunit H